MTMLVQFVVFGVGLDDTFIITSAFLGRTDRGKSIEERIRDTMEDVGLSITVTTVTTAFAFGLVRERSSTRTVHLLSNR